MPLPLPVLPPVGAGPLRIDRVWVQDEDFDYQSPLAGAGSQPGGAGDAIDLVTDPGPEVQRVPTTRSNLSDVRGEQLGDHASHCSLLIRVRRALSDPLVVCP